MNETKFCLQLWCNVGWDDDEEVGELEVDSFEGILEVVSCLKRRGENQDKELYEYIKESVDVPSGGEVFSVWDVVGIVSTMKSENGVTAQVELSDNTGISSWCKVDEEKYQSDNRKNLKEAKKLASQILRL